jgi:hypothetical protein
MANSLKESGGGLALQVTKPARGAGLVHEDAEGEPTRLSGVYVYGFDGLLVVVDAESVTAGDRAELVATAAEATSSIHRGEAASVEVAGHGYQVQLPGCKAAGFTRGDTAPVAVGDGLLVIHDGTNAPLASDLTTERAEQVA